MSKMKNLHTKGVDVRTLPVFTKNQNTAHDRARNYACEKHRLTHRGERCGRRQLHAAIKRSQFVVKWRWISAWSLRLTIYCLPAGIMPRHQTLVPGAPGRRALRRAGTRLRVARNWDGTATSVWHLQPKVVGLGLGLELDLVSSL